MQQLAHETTPEWYQFSFTRVFMAICITLLVLLAYALESVPAGAIIACAGLS